MERGRDRATSLLSNMIFGFSTFDGLDDNSKKMKIGFLKIQAILTLLYAKETKRAPRVVILR